MKSYGCQEWPWVSFWRGQGSDWEGKLEVSMQESRDAGFEAWEGTLPTDAKGLDALALSLKKSGLSLPSLYANARLHNEDSLKTVAELVTRCEKARPLGFKVLVLNPEPIDWGTAQEKSDEELGRQARSLQALQGVLAAAGITLAYHIHDSEMRSDGRELLAMLAAFPGIKLCMEAEWLLRAGWDPQRVLDFVREHSASMVSAHLRQGRARKPLISLSDGDFDYRAAAGVLAKSGFDGPVIYEGYQEARMELDAMRACLKGAYAWMKANF